MLSEYQGPTEEELATYLRRTSRRVRQMISELKNQKYLRVWKDDKNRKRNNYSVVTDSSSG